MIIVLKIKYKNAKGLSGKNKLLGQVIIAGVIASYLFIPQVSETICEKSWLKPLVVKEEGVNITVKDYASRIYMPFVKEPILKIGGLFTVLAFLFIIFVERGLYG